MNRGPCQFCGRQVTSVETAAKHASGWYVEREKGLHSLIDRKDTPNVIAHETCLRSRGQQSLSMLGGEAA